MKTHPDSYCGFQPVSPPSSNSLKTSSQTFMQNPYQALSKKKKGHFSAFSYKRFTARSDKNPSYAEN